MTKFRSFIMVSAAALTLAGCMTETTTLINSSGQTAVCEVSSGTGMIGMAIAGSERDKCIQGYESQGYSQKSVKSGIKFSQ